MLFHVFIVLLFSTYAILLGLMVARHFPRAKQSEPIRRYLPLDDSESQYILDLVSVSKAFEQPVLKGITLGVKPGETVGILGKSGSGKSVLLKLIAGFLRPDRGWVYFKGQDVGRMDEAQLLEIRKRVSYVFQSGAVFDFLSVAENIAYPLIEQGVTDEEVIRDRVDYLLDAVELEGMGEDRYDELSAGGKKQVAIGRAIANNPEVILYDEPTTGVDPIVGKALSRLIRKLNRRENLTSVVVTHDLKCMEITADRVVLLKDGSIRFEGDLEALHSSDDPYVRAFIAGTRYKEEPIGIEGSAAGSGA
ncbi:MAG: ABC transporter ATP-binding protein [Acidobacteriota bacterium]